MEEIKLPKESKTQMFLKIAKLVKIDFDNLTVKNCELFEILNKLHLYRKKPKKAYLALAYHIAIATINFIALQEL